MLVFTFFTQYESRRAPQNMVVNNHQFRASLEMLETTPQRIRCWFVVLFAQTFSSEVEFNIIYEAKREA